MNVPGKTADDVAVIIPTLGAARHVSVLLPALLGNVRPDQIWVIDSSSDDGTAEACRGWGVNVRTVDRASFNHGGTRNWARSQVAARVLVFMTQDALPAQKGAITALVRPLDDAGVAVAYGRQLPRPQAGPLEAFPRLFNYPENGAVRTKDDISRLGLKAFFCSNSFCAYRADAWDALGGFPNHILIWEDQHLAARLLLAGYRVAYVAGACVYHSHNYSLLDEFRRYFDTGALLRAEAWLRQLGSEAEGEGMRLLRAQTTYLRSAGRASLIPYSLMAAAMKYAGYRVGHLEPYLPRSVKRRLSLQPYFW